MYEIMQGHYAVYPLEALKECNFILTSERFREACISETECRHKTGELILAFCTATRENPQFWIQYHPVNIIQLSVGKLQVGAERK